VRQVVDLADLVALVARDVRLRRSGAWWLGCCPFHDDSSPSFAVRDRRFICFGCGAKGDAVEWLRRRYGMGFRDALASLAGDAGLPAPRPAAAPRRPAASDDTTRPTSDLARALWRETVDPVGTITEAYLQRRVPGFSVDGLGQVIRFHPACPRGAGERLPAMVSLMVDPMTGEPRGIHRTFLRPDASDRLREKRGEGKGKMMLGRAGVIALSPWQDVTRGLGICEGIETGLSLMHRFGWSPIWAAGSAPSIATFPVLPGLDCINIFADQDPNGTGLAAAEACALRWRDHGAEARILAPPAGDFADAGLDAAA
jgi:hypothetical protein